MEVYCRKLFTIVIQLREENADLRKQRDQMITVAKDVKSSYLARLQQQRFDINVLRKTFTDFHEQFTSLMSDAQSNFNVQTSNSAELIKHMAGENRFLHEQLNVKRMRYNALNKAHIALNKKHTEIKRHVNKKQPLGSSEPSSSSVIRCMRCKARKNVIKCLENDLTDKIREVEEANRKLEALTTEQKTAKDNLQCAKRKLFETEDKLKSAETANKKLCPENSTTPASNAALSASSNNSTTSALCVEVARTPGDDSPPSVNSVNDHSKCEKEIISLQWSINAKAAELVRLHNQGQTFKTERDKAQEESNFYRCRCDHLMNSVQELTVKVQKLERQLPDTVEMSFYRNRCEQQKVQLDQLAAKCQSLQRELAESQQSRETLRLLLSNLATSVSASMFTGK